MRRIQSVGQKAGQQMRPHHNHICRSKATCAVVVANHTLHTTATDRKGSGSGATLSCNGHLGLLNGEFLLLGFERLLLLCNVR